MTKTLTILLITAFSLAAQAPASTGSTTKKATAKSAPQATTIPKDAVANPNGTYTWTDKGGTKWTYAKTPFGLMRMQASGIAVAATPKSDVKAFDEGDKARFETITPFGVMKIEKKKSDLTDEERNLLDSQTATQTTTPAAKQD